MPPFAAFPESVHRERLQLARGALREIGAAVGVCVSPEDMYYFGGYDSWTAMNGVQGMVFSAAEDEPTLIVRDTDVAMALETTWMQDIRNYHLGKDDPLEMIASAVAERTGDGVVGFELESRGLPPSAANDLTAALRPREVIDASTALGALRGVKDATEIDYLRTAGGFAQAGLREFTAAARPGITEIELAGRIEAAARLAGSDYAGIPTELAAGNRTAAGHGTPREREIEVGDLVHLEFAGVHRRYHAVAIQTIAVGQPSGEAANLYRLGRESLAAGAAACRPGTAGADIDAASRVPLDREGLGHAAMMRFGYGIGIAYPPTWLEVLNLAEGSPHRLEVGMAVVLHACLQLTDDELGVILGGTYLITDDGAEPIAGAGACELVVVAS
jgi:Xaa-Pro aminopeptidase